MSAQKRFTYEWDTETVAEGGDILDHHFSEDRPLAALGENERLVLVRDDQDHREDRQWAYVDGAGDLPSHFHTAGGAQGVRVPKRFMQ